MVSARLTVVLGACVFSACSPAAPPAPSAAPAVAPHIDVAVGPPIADAGVGDAAQSADASTRRMTVGSGCSGPTKEAPAAPQSRCSVSGTNAYLHHVVVPIGNDAREFVEIGVYGGTATLDVPRTEDEPAKVHVRAPLEVDGVMAYSRGNYSLAHRAGGQLHPTLKVARGAPISAVLSDQGDRLRARVWFGDRFSVGPLDLACDAVSLADRNRMEDTFAKPVPDKHAPAAPPTRPELVRDPSDDTKISKRPALGTLRAAWQGDPPLVKESVDATDGLRITGTQFGNMQVGDADFDVIARTRDHLRVRVRTAAGSELLGWIPEKDVYAGGSGRGEGIGLCGCGTPGRHPDRVASFELAAGATIHASPEGAQWAKSPAPIEVMAERTPVNGWRKIDSIRSLSEGGDACPSQRLEHAWVRVNDLKAR